MTPESCFLVEALTKEGHSGMCIPPIKAVRW